MPHQERSREMQECIQECTSCHAVCLETITHCLQIGGEHAETKHIGLLQDCAQICAASADFMLRMSDYQSGICTLCADICEACAEDCERLATGEGADVMRRCADACRLCAESCRKMSISATAAASR